MHGQPRCRSRERRLEPDWLRKHEVQLLNFQPLNRASAAALMQVDLTKPIFRSHRFQHFRPILESWVTVCHKYQNTVQEGDGVLYYRERAQVGFLAAAAWLSDGVALEEWCTEKKSKNGQSRTGRADLWLQRENFRVHIEAKHVWIDLNDPTKAIQKVKGKLAVAQSDACDISHDERREHRVGVLFAAPTMRRCASPTQAETRLKEWVAGLEKLENCIALAATFDPARWAGTEGDWFPGIALLIGEATRESPLVSANGVHI